MKMEKEAYMDAGNDAGSSGTAILSACGSKLSIRQPRLRPRLPDMLWM